LAWWRISSARRRSAGAHRVPGNPTPDTGRRLRLSEADRMAAAVRHAERQGLKI